MLRLSYALLMATHLVAGMFFHEHSAIELSGGKHTGFGFSLGYQKGRDAKLVIGEPRYNHEGRVSQCSIYDITRNHMKQCTPVNINFDKLKVNRTLNPDQYFYLGASVAATQTGFVTCAPLRTTDTKVDGEPKYDAFGVCFAYDDAAKSAKPWNLHSDFSDNLLEGGGGWSTLVDDKHDRIIISQFMTSMNSVYGKISRPENYTRLLSKGGYKDYKPIVNDVTIYGQAMTLGEYFENDNNKTYYAFSIKTFRNTGAIDFFSCDDFKWTTRLEDDVVGSMFGAALGSADVTGDGRDELVVGAPAQVGDATSCDRGALHVYTASVNAREPLMKLKLTIWGVEDNGRFGTALVTNDVDGDSYPEIIVSAPFEKSGGALYILCGYEMHRLMASETRDILVTSLKRMQRIQRKHSFGLTLLPVADFNDNGSDELGIGSPEDSTVSLYKGVRAITMNITSEFKNDATATNTEFLFSSCVTIKMPPKPRKITTKLLVKNVLIGEKAFFKRDNATYVLDCLNDKGKNIGGDLVQYCRDFLIENPLSCKVNTTVFLTEDIQQMKDFKNTWVTLSAQSQLSKVTQPTCKCNGTCSPEYSLDLQWSGVNGSNHKYVVGSSNQETVTVIVRNHGTMGCDACAIVRLSGTVVHTLTCNGKRRRYVCDLPTPFRAGSNNTIDIRLLTNTLSNQERNLTVHVEMRKYCKKTEAVNSTLKVSLDFQKVLENVIIDGSSIIRPITDAELQDNTEDTLSVDETFTIVNNQTFKWSNVTIKIDANIRPYIQNVTVQLKQPTQPRVNYNGPVYNWRGFINLAQNSITEIIVTTIMTKKKLAHFLQSGDTNITVTELKLELFQDEIKGKKLITQVTYTREMGGQNNTALTIVIAFVVALVVLLLIALVLYKLNFFKRKNKQDLEELKKEMKNRSLRSDSSKASAAQAAGPPAVCCESDTVDLIVDETPFDNSLSSAQLNCLAANPEKADVIACLQEAPKSEVPSKSKVTTKSEVTPKSEVLSKSQVTTKSEATPKPEVIPESKTESDRK